MSVAQFPRPAQHEWLGWCLNGNDGKPIENVANVLTALRGDQGLRDALAYDEMQRALVLLHDVGGPHRISTRGL